MESLLGKFYNKIKGSQEDIASESLTYILQKSDKARNTLNQLINTSTGLKFGDLKYSVQNIGEKLERPDISGKNDDGIEVLIIEAKFWASLTINQPNEYLKRLGKNSALIFLVPTLRERALFEEVTSKVRECYSESEFEIYNHNIKLVNKNNFILIKTWNEVLLSIKAELQQENNQQLISDIDQIIGFCHTIDVNSFIPIESEDLSPLIPKKINSYFDIVDKVVDEIKYKNPDASTKGLYKTPHRYGYGRYFRIGKIAFRLNLKLDLWAEYADTPFWLFLKEIDEDLSWVLTEPFKKKCEDLASSQNRKYVDINNEIHVSLKPEINKTEDVVISDLADQIEFIYKELNT